MCKQPPSCMIQRMKFLSSLCDSEKEIIKLFDLVLNVLNLNHVNHKLF